MGRTPHGVRGLKYRTERHRDEPCRSHPSRGAWIEIAMSRPAYADYGRTPHGVRGLKSEPDDARLREARRTPHGVRGLKSNYAPRCRDCPVSHPSRGAWIEITTCAVLRNSSVCRTPHGVRGLKSRRCVRRGQERESHPSRGAWIEIRRRTFIGVPRYVAPLTGCVD